MYVRTVDVIKSGKDRQTICVAGVRGQPIRSHSCDTKDMLRTTGSQLEDFCSLEEAMDGYGSMLRVVASRSRPLVVVSSPIMTTTRSCRIQ